MLFECFCPASSSPRSIFQSGKCKWWPDAERISRESTLIATFTCRTLQPICLGGFLSHFNRTDDDEQMIFGFPSVNLWAAGIVGCSILSIAINHPFVVFMLHLGIKLRLSLCAMLYRKVRSTSVYCSLIPFINDSILSYAGANENQIRND